MVDANIIKKTQESLGKVIKKPPLTEKLLSKPPFRYLHDIISEVTKQSGFLDGLYDDKELTAANIKDKDAKIAYLQKAIDTVGLVIGSQLSVRPTKIIAGAEPDKTNEFLQYLGKCAAKGANQDAIQRVKNGEKPAKKSDKERSKSKDKRSKDGREISKERSKDGREVSKERSKERDSTKGRSKREQSTSKERVSASSKERTSASKSERPGREQREKREERKDKRKEKSEENLDRRDKDEKRERRRREKQEEKQTAQAEPPQTDLPQPQPEPEPEVPPQEEQKSLTNGFHETEDDEQPPARIPRPSSAKGTRRRPKDEPDRDTEPSKTYAEVVAAATIAAPAVPIVAGKRRERPTSARPAPPRIKKKEDEEEEQNVRQGSGLPTAGIIVDNSAEQQDDDDMFVKEETGDALPQIRQPVNMESGQHGGLVQKIIDSQKQYSTGDKEKDEKVPIMNQAARQKERAIVKKEIDQLRVGIQTLASSAAPLGKVLDYMQEDLDSMQKELETWRSENKYHETAIKAEESHMDKTLEPLKEQLEDIDRHILDMINKINATKCNIHNNDMKIEQMLSTMSFTPS